MKRKTIPGLILALLLALACVFAFAEEAEQIREIISGDWVYLRSGETAELIRYTGSETDLVIPDTLDGLPVIIVGEPDGYTSIFTEANREKIRSVQIPDSVLMIGRSAFYRCSALEKVNIPDHIAAIQDECFAETALTEITLPGHLVEIGRRAFANTPLRGISLPASLRWIGTSAFEGCTQLTEIAWPGSQVYLAYAAFRNTGIPEEGFTLPESCGEYTNRYYFYSPADASGRTDISDTVWMTYVRKPDGTVGILDTCINEGAPDTLKIPAQIEGMPVTGYYGVLTDYSGILKTLILPDTMTEIGDMALQQLHAGKIELPKKLKKIGYEALMNCRRLKEIKLPKTLEQIGYSSFRGSGAGADFQKKLDEQVGTLGLERKYVDAYGSIGKYADSDIIVDGLVCELRMDEESGEAGLVLWQLDSRCTVKESGDSLMNVPFVSVPGKSLQIRGGIAYKLAEEGDSLTPMQVMDSTGWDLTFPEKVDGLPVVIDTGRTIPFVTDGLICELRSDGEAGICVLGAEEGRSGGIPETVGEFPVTWLGDGMTLEQDGIVYRGIPDMAKSVSVSSVHASDAEINLPEDVHGWKVVRIDSGAFENLENLKGISIPESVEEIRESAFSDCPNLTSIEVANPKTSISETAFRCIGVKWPEVNGKTYSAGILMENGDLTWTLFADGTAEILHIASPGKTARIPAEIDGHPVISVGDAAFWGSEISAAELPEGLLRVGNEAFSSCQKLKSVKFPSTLEYIGDYAFSSNDKLGKIKLPDSLRHLGEQAFADTGLGSVELPEGLETIGAEAFRNCGKLTTVTLPKSLRAIGDRAFDNCRKLSKLTLPEGLETLGTESFRNSALKKVTIPASVKTIGDRCFSKYGENNGTGTTFWDGPEIVFLGDPEVTGELFGLLDSLPNYSYTEFFDYEELFVGQKMTKLKITTVPGTAVDRLFLSPLVVEKTYPAEKDMTAGETPVKETLEAGDIPQGIQILTVPEGVKQIAPGAFRRMNGLYKVILPESLEEIGEGAFEDCGGLQQVVFGTGLRKLGARAFAGCRNLREAILPDGLEEIPENCFLKDINLKKVKIPAGLKKIADSAFESCCYLEDADFSACASLETIGKRAFYQSSIKKIVMPDSLVSLGTEAFAYPVGLTSLTFSAGLEEIQDSCFFYCSHLTSLEIPAHVRTIGEYAFYNARAMKNLLLQEGLETIGKGAFSCQNDKIIAYNARGKKYSMLGSVTIPASLRSLGGSAFAGCDALGKIVFAPEFSIDTIPDSCFMLCTSLKEIRIPGAIRAVENRAFYNCLGLSKVTAEEGTVSFGTMVFSGCENLKNLNLPSTLASVGRLLLDNNGKGVTITAPAGSYADQFFREKYQEARFKNP